MEASQFASVYRSNLTEQTRQSGVLPELMNEAREWSYRFGQALHRHLLAPEEHQAEDAELMLPYSTWLNQALPVVEQAAWALNTPESLKAANELGFHRLNMGMRPMWLPVFNGGWNCDPSLRSLSIHNTQDLLALQGLRYYVTREKISGLQTDYVYFAEENGPLRNSYEGMLNELDAGIVLTEIVRKRPDLTVVPAPMQFERGFEGRYNVDFLVISERGKAVGVQVKSKVKDEHRGRYDAERVVLLDANTELGNVRAKRTRTGSSAVRQVSWAGMICAQRVGAIPSHGERVGLLQNQGLDLRFINRQKMVAKTILRGVRPRWEEATAQAGPRILSRV